MSGTRPYDLDEDYSTIVLGTARSPGVVTLSGHDRPKNWDVQAAKGTTGASSSLNGDRIGTFKATFYLCDDAPDPDSEELLNDFERWERFQFLIEAMTAGPEPVALPIYHPDLARNHITEVTNGGVSGMVHDGKGGATVTVTFIEFKPPKPKKSSKATAKPSSSVPGGGAAFGPPPPPKVDPNAAAKAELDALLAEAKRL